MRNNQKKKARNKVTGKKKEPQGYGLNIQQMDKMDIALYADLFDSLNETTFYNLDDLFGRLCACYSVYVKNNTDTVQTALDDLSKLGKIFLTLARHANFIEVAADEWGNEFESGQKGGI